MKGVLRSFFMERRKELVLLLGAAVIWGAIFWAYALPVEVMGYAGSLVLLWIVLLGIWDFVKYWKKQKQLLDSREKILTSAETVEGMAEPESLTEKQYQELVRQLCKEKAELESAGRIYRQEMADYYGMWIHQIKTPIAALKLLLQNGEERCGARGTEVFRGMKMEVFKIEQYAEMVLTYLRMENISGDFTFDVYPLDGIMRQVVHKCSQMFVLTQTKLYYEPLQGEILTDEKWLAFVLEQLLSNALKYARGGNISIYLENRELVIADDGMGIAAENLPRIFEKGFTGYNGRSDKKSTGIGLYLCKTILDKLRHRIRIESEIGAGTRVYLRFDRKSVKME